MLGHCDGIGIGHEGSRNQSGHSHPCRPSRHGHHGSGRCRQPEGAANTIGLSVAVVESYHRLHPLTNAYDNAA